MAMKRIQRELDELETISYAASGKLRYELISRNQVLVTLELQKDDHLIVQKVLVDFSSNYPFNPLKWVPVNASTTSMELMPQFDCRWLGARLANLDLPKAQEAVGQADNRPWLPGSWSPAFQGLKRFVVPSMVQLAQVTSLAQLLPRVWDHISKLTNFTTEDERAELHFQVGYAGDGLKTSQRGSITLSFDPMHLAFHNLEKWPSDVSMLTYSEGHDHFIIFPIALRTCDEAECNALMTCLQVALEHGWGWHRTTWGNDDIIFPPPPEMAPFVELDNRQDQPHTNQQPPCLRCGRHGLTTLGSYGCKA